MREAGCGKAGSTTGSRPRTRLAGRRVDLCRRRRAAAASPARSALTCRPCRTRRHRSICCQTRWGCQSVRRPSLAFLCRPAVARTSAVASFAEAPLAPNRGSGSTPESGEPCTVRRLAVARQGRKARTQGKDVHSLTGSVYCTVSNKGTVRHLLYRAVDVQ